MKIDTTITITEKNFLKLQSACESTGKSVNSLARKLLKKMMKRHERYARLNLRIKYQKRYQGIKTMHLYLHEKEYEFNLDMRRIYKMSVSLILSQAIDKFLHQILKIFTHSLRDDFACNTLNHSLIIKSYSNSTLFSIIWQKNEVLK